MSARDGVFKATVSSDSGGFSDQDLEGLFYGIGDSEEDEGPQARLLSWEYTDHAEEMDEFSFTLDNHDLKLFDSELLQKGNRILIQFGRGEQLSEEFDCRITGRSGWRDLTISGQLAKEGQLANKASTEKFLNKTVSQVAEILFKREDLDAEVDDTEIVHKQIMKTNETSFQFLKRKAAEQEDDYVVYVEDGTGYFVKKQFGIEPLARLVFGSEEEESELVTLGEPEFLDDQQNQPAEAVVKGFDIPKKKFIKETVNNENSKQPSLGQKTFVFDESASGKFGEGGVTATKQTGVITHTPKKKKGLVKQQAQGKFNKKTAKSYKMSWTVMGDGTIKAKNNYEVVCPSAQVSGNWYVESVNHSGRGGDYTSSLEMTRNALTGSDAVAQAKKATPSAPSNVAEAPPTPATDEVELPS